MNDKAFLVHLDTPPTHYLFEDEEYRFTERHFSIDKTYRTSRTVHHGYTPIHYTENYESDSTGEFITVHVYLDKQGQYIYSQIKKRSIDPAEIVDLKVKKEQIELLKINVSSSIAVLSPLFNARQERYLKLKKEAEALELQLLTLSSTLHNFTSLEAYKKIAKECIEVIKRLNQYTELADPRGKMLADSLKKLEELSVKIQSASATASLALSAEAESIEPAEDSAAPVEPKRPTALETLYSALFQDLQSLKEQLADKTVYSPDNLEKIKRRDEIVKEANLKLMALFEFPDVSLNESSRKKKLKKLIEKTSALINQHEKEGTELLMQGSLEGNLKVVQTLYLKVQEEKHCHIPLSLQHSKLLRELYCFLARNQSFPKTKKL